MKNSYFTAEIAETAEVIKSKINVQESNPCLESLLYFGFN